LPTTPRLCLSLRERKREEGIDCFPAFGTFCFDLSLVSAWSLTWKLAINPCSIFKEACIIFQKYYRGALKSSRTEKPTYTVQLLINFAMTANLLKKQAAPACQWRCNIPSRRRTWTQRSKQLARPATGVRDVSQLECHPSRQ
jgi:hypothetical protein